MSKYFICFHAPLFNIRGSERDRKRTGPVYVHLCSVRSCFYQADDPSPPHAHPYPHPSHPSHTPLSTHPYQRCTGKHRTYRNNKSRVLLGCRYDWSVGRCQLQLEAGNVARVDVAVGSDSSLAAAVHARVGARVEVSPHSARGHLPLQGE